MPMKLFATEIWTLEPLPSYLNVWLFKTNHVVGRGEWGNYQKLPATVTLRIVVAGQWCVKTCGVSRMAMPGDVFLATPREPFYFAQTLPKARFEWYEIQFCGQAAEQFPCEYGLSMRSPVITPDDPKRALLTFKKIGKLMVSKERTVPAMLSLMADLMVCCNKKKHIAPEMRTDLYDDIVARSIERMRSMIATGCNVNQLAEALGVDRTTLYRAFKKKLDTSIHDYFDKMKMERAVDLLLYTDLPVAAIAGRSGFPNEKYFMTWYKARKGLPPGVWRERNRGVLT